MQDPSCLQRGEVVELRYEDLLAGADVTQELEKAFGPGGLGICIVCGVPGYAELRQSLLPLAAALASLPEAAKSALEDPESSYNFGWSCGRETLEGGQPDTQKGSFYGNPLHDVPPGADADLQRRHPSYCRPNRWPQRELPQLEAAFKALGRLIVDVGLLLTRHCDKLLAAAGHLPRLHDILQRSPCPKGRLLHYFPPAPSSAGCAAAKGAGNWCGWHKDHGSLTGLTSAMYLDAAGQPATSPDPRAGLHIRDRAGRIVQVAIPEGSIAYQMGEAMQVHSGGLLQATPHCVVAPAPELSAGISRNTFAVFLQPKWDCAMELPQGVRPEDVDVPKWRPGLDFGGFSELKYDGYYRQQ